ncbi:MAG: hypothetical protein V4456_00915 [Bacteroidota bacterium]|jgi:hypothetical protein|uniref:hypothetical protein n=1 Tax=Mucilaginibacter sp. TaxID=1882438 RepID=UPI000B2D69BB
MKNLIVKNFKKKTNKLYSFNHLSGINSTDTPTDTIIGDPTNTTITVLTTVSGPTHFNSRQNGDKLRV